MLSLWVGNSHSFLDMSRLDWLHWLETVPSTNSWAIDHAQKLRHGDVVFTPRQTAGRGQFDRVWQAPPGVLTASFVLDGWLGEKSLGFSLAAGLAVIYAIEDLLPPLPAPLQLKWPNDVWHQGRKLAGILCEQVGPRLIVGVGCNRQVDFQALSRSINPISLHQIAPQPPDELALIASLRHYLLEAAALVQYQGLSPLLPVLQQRDPLQGQFLRLELADRTILGIGAGIDAQGRLQIQSGETIQAFASGKLQL